MDDKIRIDEEELKKIVDKDKKLKKLVGEDEEDKRKFPGFILLFLITTFGVILALGLSFSAIKLIESNETINTLISRIKGEDDNKEKFIITYVENSGQFEAGINLKNQFPTRDEVGKLFEGENYVYNFSLLVGKDTVGAYYELTAVEGNDNNLNPSYVKLYLEKNKVAVSDSFRNTGRVKVYTDYQNSEYQEANGKVIYKGYVTEEDVKRGKIDFVMRMWISEDVQLGEDSKDVYSNRKFSVTVNTYATYLNR